MALEYRHLVTQLFFMAVFLLIFQSCSTEMAFESIRMREKIQCQNLPASQYDECMEKLGDSYETYKQKREELNKEE